MCQTFQAFWNDEIVIRHAFQHDLFFLRQRHFCEPRFDTDITVWIRPRLLSGGLELVGKCFPSRVAGRQPVLEYVSTGDMTELTMYSLPPVRVFQARGRRELQD